MSATQEVGDIFGTGIMLRSPTVLIASVGLWGMNIYVFKLFSIDYIKVLNHDLLKLEDQYDRVTEQQEQQQQQQQLQQQQRRFRNRANNNNSNYLNTSTSSFDDDLTPTTSCDGLMDGSTNSGSGGKSSSTVLSSMIIPLDIDTDHTTATTTAATNSNGGSSKIIDGADSHRNQEKITSSRLIGFSMVLLLLLHSTYTIHIQILGGNPIWAVFAFYFIVIIVIVFPVMPSTTWLRIATKLVTQRLYALIHPKCYCIPSISSSLIKLPMSNNGVISNGDEEKINVHSSSTNGGNGSSSINSNKIPRPIPFIDVFVADAMCSLSKVFFDWGVLLLMAMNYPNKVPENILHILLPSSFAALPYIIRARQCIVMWHVTSMKNDHMNKYQHLWNALKYCTSIFPLCLSAYKSISKKNELEPLLILLLVVNASYALWWDIVMDWGMMKNPTVAATALCSFPLQVSPSSYQIVPARDVSTTSSSSSNEIMMRSPMGRNPSGVISLPLQSSTLLSGNTSSSPSSVSCWHSLLRNRLRFGVWISVVILVTDIVLRFSWTLRFYHKLFPSPGAFVLFTQFLEIFRRALWNLLRVEWENLKQSGQHHQYQPQHITNNKPMTPASAVLIQMTSMSNNGSNSNNIMSNSGNSNDEETTSFLRSNASVGKLSSKW